jgi:MFS family permease
MLFLNQEKRALLLGWTICILAALFYCYEYLLRIMPSVMVPQLTHRFNLEVGSVGMLASLYYYAYTPLQIAVGVTIDRFGPRKVLINAIFLCALGTYIFGYSDILYLVGLGRILVGFGSAFAFVGLLKLAAIWLPKNHFPIFTGIATSMGMLGAIYGDIELTRIVEHSGWPRAMLLSVCVGLLLVALFYCVVKERRIDSAEKKHYDLWPVLFHDFFQIIKMRQLWLVGLIGCVLYLSLTVIAEMWGIPFLGKLFPHRPDIIVRINAMIFVGWLVGSPLMGWLSNSLKSRKKPIIFGMLSAACMVLLIILWVPNNLYIMGSLFFLFGLFSSAEILSFVIARESVPIKMVASAIAFVNLLVMLGGMIVQPAVGYLIDLGWRGHTAHGAHIYSLLTYRMALMVVPIIMIMSLPFSMKIRDTFDK